MPKKVVRGAEKSIQITIRVGHSVVERADELIEYVSETRALPVARADVLREALTVGLATLKHRAEKAKADEE